MMVFRNDKGMHKENPGLLISVFCIPAFKQETSYLMGKEDLLRKIFILHVFPDI